MACWEIDDCNHLTANQLVASVSFGDLGTRLLNAKIAKIDLQLQGGVSGTSVRSSGHHGADAEIEFQKLI